MPNVKGTRIFGKYNLFQKKKLRLAVTVTFTFTIQNKNLFLKNGLRIIKIFGKT